MLLEKGLYPEAVYQIIQNANVASGNPIDEREIKTMMRSASDTIAKKKVTDRSWSDERWIVDTFTMMTEQPRTLTLNCFDDFQCLEDCTYSEFAKQQHVKEFLEG